MSKLTEIMKQIPLDELLGDADKTTNTERNITETTGGNNMNNEEMRSNIKHTGAYAKRTGALVSAAAIALVAIGGAFAYSKLSKNSPSPKASDINTSVAASQASSQPSAPVSSAASKAVLEEYLKNKPVLKDVGYTLSSVFIDVDADHGYGLYRSDGLRALCKVSSGTVTEYSEIETMNYQGVKCKAPFDIYDSAVFEMNGSKFAALLVETASDGGYAPAVMIITLDGDEPKCADFGFYYLNMKRYSADAEIVFTSENGIQVLYSLGDKSPAEVMTLKDAMEIRDNGFVLEGTEYTFRNGEIAPEYRVILEDYVKNSKSGENTAEISKAYTTVTAEKYAYGAYYDLSPSSGSVLCKISGQTVVEYTDKFFTDDSNMHITGRIYDMCNYYVGDTEFLAILADKVTNGGMAPMVILLDITSESPVAVMDKPVMINMTHYEKDAQIINDGDTVLYGLTRFDDTLSAYLETTEDGFKIDGRIFTFMNGKLLEAQ